MQLVRGRWKEFWFSHGSPRNLAVARIVLAAQGLWIVLSRDYAAISGLPSPFWSGVDPAWQWRFLVFPGFAGERVLQWLAIAALVAALIGVFPRVACGVAGLVLYHLAPLESIIWTSTAAIRGLTLTIPGLILMSLSRCGDTLSVWPRPRATASVEAGIEYSWQLRLIQLLVCQVYLFSAVAKIETSGFAWLSGDNMRNWFLYLSQVPDTAVFSAPGAWIARHPVLAAAIGWTTVIFEAGFISVMFSSWARRILVPAGLLFHVGIVFTLNLTFPAMPLLLLFVNWDWVSDRMGSRTAGWEEHGGRAPEDALQAT